MRSESPDVTGVVLAGGDSRRFDAGDKALATLDGETFIERVLGELRASTAQPPIVAVRTETQRKQLHRTISPSWDGRFVLDDGSLTGPLAGLLSACETASTPWIFAVGCDMPLLDSRAIDEVCVRVPRDAERAPEAVVPVSQHGRREPLHAVYRRSAIVNCRRHLSNGDSFNALLTALDDVDYAVLDELPQLVRLSVTNVNTLSELERVATSVEGERSD
ncbi:molybdopterin-guanine dinucleotide biosynthesis protein A [Halogeometricum rufum]|uniref:Probable molybdenum cofactor guanylyltransferase n=1 Tax=Halogeometricum rufum TaxID=553469 RepID=A0A1I6IJE6_9EURY|nr:molybdenum cofactor guanylyltransferase [Halogeometricum rufum]SFR66789.1 molybdopterin-guanine dinucleotide biosynthesis protein A [Halogeometricum rufum]